MVNEQAEVAENMFDPTGVQKTTAGACECSIDVVPDRQVTCDRQAQIQIQIFCERSPFQIYSFQAINLSNKQ